MVIVGGFGVHRTQITFDYLDTETGEVRTGQISPATRAQLRGWLAERLAARNDVAFAVEGCTGWRFVIEDLIAAGVEAHLAESVDTATQRDSNKRAKTDRSDARLQRQLLSTGELPESWIPPVHVLEVRTLGRLYLALRDERRAWQQRIHAHLFHQGASVVRKLLSAEGREELADVPLPPAGREMVDSALSTVDSLTSEIEPLCAQLRAIGRSCRGARVLIAHYGIGPLCAAIIWAELGDCRRFASSDDAVRSIGLDVIVYSSDSKREPDRLARQGSPELRWALLETAKSAAHHSSPDHDCDAAVRDRLGGKRPALSVARKLARRCHPTLRALGDETWLPIPLSPPEAKAA